MFNKKKFYLRYYGIIISIFVGSSCLAYFYFDINDRNISNCLKMGVVFLIIILLSLGLYIADILEKYHEDSYHHISTIYYLVDKYKLLEKLKLDLKKYDVKYNPDNDFWDKLHIEDALREGIAAEERCKKKHE